MQATDDTPPRITDAEFLDAIFGAIKDDERLWVCHFKHSPESTETPHAWGGRAIASSAEALSFDNLNAYFSVSVLKKIDGTAKRDKRHFSRMCCVVVDDARAANASWTLETSPGNFQSGFILAQDIVSVDVAARLQKELSHQKLVSADANGYNPVRYVRLPSGVNTKYSGSPALRLVDWNPELVFSVEDIAGIFNLNLDLILNGPKAQPGEPPQPDPDRESDSDLILAIVTGESYHDQLNILAARYRFRGFSASAATTTLRGIMMAVQVKDVRWQVRFADIERSVRGAFEKFPAGSPDEPVISPEGLILNLSQLEAQASSVKWLIKHVIPDNALGMIFGASGTYKSFIALDMGLHVAHGLPWLDKKTQSGPVVYIAAEGGAGIWSRIKAWHMQPPHAMPINHALPFYVCPVAIDLGSAGGSLAIQQAITALAIVPRLVIVDTMSQTFAGDENERGSVAGYLRLIGRDIREKFSCNVTIVHHTGHSASERPRGSSALIADLDYIYGVFREKDDATATVECLKQKDGDKPLTMNFHLQRHVLGRDDDGEELSSLAAIYLNNPAAIIAAVNTRQDGDKARLLELAITGADEKEVRKAYYGLRDGTDEAKKKAWNRAKDWAIKGGILTVSDGKFVRLID